MSVAEAVKKRLLVFVVAYNAEKTIQSVLNRIPIELSDQYETEVLVIDDSSKDATFEKACYERESSDYPFPLTVLFNPSNQGYGGNQKLGYHYAITHGFDFVAMIHGDGQYAPELLPDMLKSFDSDSPVGAVFGSRMINKKDALKGGMPLYKYYGNQILTGLQNFILNAHLSEFHSGYRIYAIEALRKIPFELNNNDFHFDTEIIIQLLFKGLPIREVPIPTHYGDEVCHVNGIQYAWNIMVQSIIAKLQRFHILHDPKYDCRPEEESRHRILDMRLDLFTPESKLIEQVERKRRIVVCGENGVKMSEKLISVGCDVRTLKTEEEVQQELSQQGDPLLDFWIFSEGMEVFEDPLRVLLDLKNYLRRSPEAKIEIYSSNVAFIAVRMMLLFGRFNYSKRGVLNRSAKRLYTIKNLKSLVSQAGYTVSGVDGYPVPYEIAMGKGVFSVVFGKINRFFIWMNRSIFSYQFCVIAKPLKSVEHLLEDAFFASKQRR